jgi:hypothetical protein
MMKASRLPILIASILLGLFIAAIPARIVQADAGPKPSMQFIFTSQMKPGPTILSGQLLECANAACTEFAPLQQLGPQHFECQTNTCNSVGYNYSPYHRLVIEFSDGVTRQSNIFTKHAYAADYVVMIYENGLEVEEKNLGPNVPFFHGGAPTLFDLLATLTLPLMEIILPIVLVALAVRTGRAGATLAAYNKWLQAAWLLAVPATIAGIIWTRGLIITLVVELLLGAGYALWRKRPVDVILTVILLLNLITQPVLWVTISAFSGLSPVFLIVFAELAVWLIEAGGLYLSQRNSMPFREALWVSLALNAASFIVGGLLPV